MAIAILIFLFLAGAQVTKNYHAVHRPMDPCLLYKLNLGDDGGCSWNIFSVRILGLYVHILYALLSRSRKGWFSTHFMIGKWFEPMRERPYSKTIPSLFKVAGQWAGFEMEYFGSMPEIISQSCVSRNRKKLSSKNLESKCLQKICQNFRRGRKLWAKPERKLFTGISSAWSTITFGHLHFWREPGRLSWHIPWHELIFMYTSGLVPRSLFSRNAHGQDYSIVDIVASKTCLNQGSTDSPVHSEVYEWHVNNPYFSFRFNSIKPRKYSIYVK